MSCVYFMVFHLCFQKHVCQFGFLSQQLTGYEKKRNQNVEENLQVLKSFEIKSLSRALFGSNHSGNTKDTHKRKNKAGRGNIDEDYLPSNGEGRVSSSEEDDDSLNDDVSSGSQANKVMYEGRGYTFWQIIDLLLISSSSITGKKRVRGPTRGKNVDSMRKTLRHPIPIVINPETMSIEGKYATSVACAIGLNIRDHALVRDIRWGDIDFRIRESIILRVWQMFGLGDYKNDMVVRRVIDIKCQSLYANWKCDLYKHYKDLKEKKVSDIKSRALYPCNPNDWVFYD
ncbi:hypothetical protein RHSIM_Rhsim07G0151700 [Rhododendron simsii]|uniref:Uncharacterized protein n=1 Tax=Rhododendron simsii TaxID=118357 RepID=A0A834GL86_RHOSS|nr:hypothetical protein RHSIM_Rhsim07G0151700 [Rhododendron simsii]